MIGKYGMYTLVKINEQVMRKETKNENLHCNQGGGMKVPLVQRILGAQYDRTHVSGRWQNETRIAMD